MKNVILIVLFLVSGVLTAQDAVNKRLGDFHEVRVYRGLDVELVKSESPRVVIKGPNAADVTVKNINGVLKISISIVETFNVDDVRVYLHYIDDIQAIKAYEGARVHAEQTLKQERILLKSESAAEIDLSLDVNYLDVKAYTGGKLRLRGLAINQNILCNTGGKYDAGDLDSEYVNISASTGGDATVYVTKVIDASANIGAIIRIKGNPKEVNKKESLGGFITY